MSELSINNTSIKIYKTSEFLKLDVRKPDIQRIIDQNKLSDIIHYQIEHNKRVGYFNFNSSGIINIHNLNNVLYLVDGQHRIHSLEKLYNDYGHDISFRVLEVQVNNYDELRENYEIINKNTPLPDFSNYSVNKKIYEQVAEDFQLKYPEMWSSTSRTHRPKLFFNYFQEALAYICSETNITDSRDLFKIIDDYNNKLSRWRILSFKGVTINTYNKANENNFYLGLWSFIDEDYRYEWAKKIVEDLTGRIIKNSKIKKKGSIPKKVKNDCWNKYIGTKIGETICICCRNTKIHQHNFTAGHIISEKNGGLINVDNILPICNSCNLSMGITNMDEFITQYYPENYSKFLKRDYNENNSGIISHIKNFF